MAHNDFYNIKDLGDLPAAEEPSHPDPSYLPPPMRNRRPKRKLSLGTKLVFLVVLAVVVLGVVAVLVSNRPNKAKTPSQSLTTLPTTSSNNTSSTQKYISNGSDLNLSFNYPSNWSTVPLSDDNSNDQTITLTSPITAITDAAGVKVTGRVTVSIRPGSASIAELNADSPTAAVASSQIAYNTPTANQYQYPYITFIHFSTGLSTAGAFEEVMITGTTQFAQGQAMSAIELSGLDPIISASFTKCTSQSCTGTSASPLSINNATWTSAAIFQQTLALFESFELN